MLNKKKNTKLSEFLPIGFTCKWWAQVWYNSVYAPHIVFFRKYFNFSSCYLEQTSEIKEQKFRNKKYLHFYGGMEVFYEIKNTSIFISKEIVYSHAFSSYLTTAYKLRDPFNFNWFTKYRVELNPKVACKNSSSSLGFAGGSGNFVLLRPAPPHFWVLLFQAHAGVTHQHGQEKQGHARWKCSIRYDEVQKAVSSPERWLAAMLQRN